ncbi:glycosyltransferase family 4 protein [Candidatus Roizmanbacteria bacterium]|nr:glycosyltransferase family 4 protein [Candidatus Roizmanbacteria bacterium]
MVIGIDGNEANVEQKVGVSVYTASLLEQFHIKADKNLQFKIFLKKTPSPSLPSENNYFAYEIVRPSVLWSQVVLPLSLRKHNDLTVFFSPAHYAPRFCHVPYVVTIHDLSYLYYPNEFLKKDLYKLKNWTKYSVKRAKKVICVSHTTKQDLMRFYSVPEDKIEVVYNGYKKIVKHSKFNPSTSLRIDGEQSRTINVLSSRFKISAPYLLYVGTLQPRKNLTTLIKAFEMFKKTNPEFKLVIAGKKGWLYKHIFQTVKDLSLRKDVVFTGYVSDEELARFYRNAFCLVHPSLYEGFGIPILEAMSYDCPVIASNTSSLPEVGGDACLYFDPQNVGELFKKLLLLSENQTKRLELIQKGRQRIKLFSWEKCATQTLDILKNVA